MINFLTAKGRLLTAGLTLTRTRITNTKKNKNQKTKKTVNKKPEEMENKEEDDADDGGEVEAHSRVFTS